MSALAPYTIDGMASKKAAPEGPIEVPEIISILPLRNSVLFPGSIIPIDVGRKKSVKLVEEAISKERPVIGIVTQRDARTEDPGPGDLYMVGCAARILKVIKLAKDNFSVILQGVSRIRLLEIGGQRSVHDRARAGAAGLVGDRRRAGRAGDERQGRRQAGHQADARAAQGGERAGRQRRRAGAAVRRDHLAPGRAGGREAGRPGDVRPQGAAAQGAGVPVAPARGAEGPREDQQPGAGGDGAQPARVRPAPAAEGDQGRAGRDRRDGRRPGRLPREDRGREDAGRHREGRDEAAGTAEGDAAVVGRVHGDAHVPGVAGRAALVGRRPRTSSTSRRRATS